MKEKELVDMLEELEGDQMAYPVNKYTHIHVHVHSLTNIIMPPLNHCAHDNQKTFLQHIMIETIK